MGQAKHHKMEEQRGDTFSKQLTFNDESGAKDITGWTIYFTVKKDKSDADTDAVINKEVTTHDDPTNGVTSITVSATKTDDLEGPYYYDIQSKSDKGVVNTVVMGMITFGADVTQRS